MFTQYTPQTVIVNLGERHAVIRRATAGDSVRAEVGSRRRRTSLRAKQAAAKKEQVEQAKSRAAVMIQLAVINGRNNGCEPFVVIGGKKIPVALKRVA